VCFKRVSISSYSSTSGKPLCSCGDVFNSGLDGWGVAKDFRGKGGNHARIYDSLKGLTGHVGILDGRTNGFNKIAFHSNFGEG
jgi:hypothetical protein